MNRFGCAIAALIAVIVGGFFLLTTWNGADQPQVPDDPVNTAASPDQDLSVPVAGVGRKDLIDTFGQTRDDGARPHGALDIMAPAGTPVVAAAAGRVEKLFDSDRGGHTIYIRSADGRFIYYYAHLDRYAAGLVEGQQVRRGASLGAVGTSGNADPAGPHLHFEIKRMAVGDKWWQGEVINPYPLLAAANPSG